MASWNWHDTKEAKRRRNSTPSKWPNPKGRCPCGIGPDVHEHNRPTPKRLGAVSARMVDAACARLTDRERGAMIARVQALAGDLTADPGEARHTLGALAMYIKALLADCAARGM